MHFFSYSHENEKKKSSEKNTIILPKNGKNVHIEFNAAVAHTLLCVPLSFSLHICTRWIAFKLSREEKIHDNSNIQWKTNQYTHSAQFMRWKESTTQSKTSKKKWKNKWAVPLTRFVFFTFFVLLFYLGTCMIYVFRSMDELNIHHLNPNEFF